MIHAHPAPSPRLLFSSYHCYLDPSSGAALATRDLLELLAGSGWPCGVFSGPQLDYEHGESLEQLLSDYGMQPEVRHGSGSAPFSVYHFVQRGLPVSVYHTPNVRPLQPPSRELGMPFLSLFEQVLDKFRPDVLLTYGGHWLAHEVIASAKRRSIRVVFALYNFAYGDASFFRPVDAVLVPSRFSQAYYQRTLGIQSTAIPCVLNWSRVHCPVVEGKYVTFVNPQPIKGVFLFARLAQELARLRSDIPLLVKEGRARADWLGRTRVDLSGQSNLYSMAHTPDPREFYRVSRLVLMPSLWLESFGRVAAEACLNGIPVLASKRGALPETLAEAGFLFDVAERYTPDSRLVPSAAEVAPWVETITRLWDDPSLYEQERRRCLAAAEAWRPDRLLPRYQEFFSNVCRSGGTAGA
ncbi:MAG TPA: glycosyltransferase [Gemmataceae bacterium]|jgi:glycosyltransferase involved in cell wall biosynthesis|nr:glycosyltransferase [Gemmataceae bacterium]